mmetsp:Transcript_132614/g.412346  ORF Transcript_132614/g.412346 Transcript_132614/m.412346 type:complete len:208 (+) Transcript_132614:155-778(+)
MAPSMSATFLAGFPPMTELSGNTLFSPMNEPAATRQLLPTLELSSIVVLMPIRQWFPTEHPWRHTWWPTRTWSPMVMGLPGSQCKTELSWMSVPSPIVMSSLSPRTVQLNHTEESRSILTVPMTVAPGAIHAVGWISGLLLPSCQRPGASSTRSFMHASCVETFANCFSKLFRFFRSSVRALARPSTVASTGASSSVSASSSFNATA